MVTAQLSGCVPGFNCEDIIDFNYENEDAEIADVIVDELKPDTDVFSQFDDINIKRWVFENSELTSQVTLPESTATDDDYWLPVKKYCSLSQDKLVITMEGIEYKKNLPAIRQGSVIPWTFLFIDKHTDSTRIIRLKEEIELTFTRDLNRCTSTPSYTCPIIETEVDNATMLTAYATTALAALVTFLSF